MITNELVIKYKNGELSRKEEVALVKDFISFVEIIVLKMNIHLPNNIDIRDLYSAGAIGLLDALKKFKIEFGYSFKTYAYYRIRGEVIEELRRMDIYKRAERKKIKEGTLKENVIFPLEKMEDRDNFILFKNSKGTAEDEIILKDTVAKLSGVLTKKERAAVEFRYFDELSIKEIGKLLSVSESRASQLINNAIKRIRAYDEKLDLVGS